MYIFSLFHRDETKPTHIIGINTFLFFMQLIYKHSSPNYQHMINYWKLINKMLVYIRVRKLKHFQPHSLLCHLWCILFAIYSFFYVIYSYMIIWKVDEAASTNFFFSSYTILFTLLINCFNTVLLTEQSLHHNIILEKLDHCWIDRTYTKIVISDSHTTSLFHI